MPLYVNCPHCEHPAVLLSAAPGRCYRCRQCGGHYVIQTPKRQAGAPLVEGERAKRDMKRAV